MKCNNSVSIYKDGMWICGSCGSTECVEEWNDLKGLFSGNPFYFETECTCGAEKTYGKNTGHASYCDKSPNKK